MNCPHCGIAFHEDWKIVDIQTNSMTQPAAVWKIRSVICPGCRNSVFELERYNGIPHPQSGAFQHVYQNRQRVFPVNTYRRPTPVEIPTEIREDYEEACKVLPISHKAAAALTRRCLQAVLRGQGYGQRDLAKQIDALLNEPDPTKAIPSALRQTVDAVRNFGNFSAHPVTDQTTLQIIDVDLGEAEWCLDILDEMFDHYYVKPAQAAARKAALDEKLQAAGKPRSK